MRVREEFAILAWVINPYYQEDLQFLLHNGGKENGWIPENSLEYFWYSTSNVKASENYVSSIHAGVLNLTNFTNKGFESPYQAQSPELVFC